MRGIAPLGLLALAACHPAADQTAQAIKDLQARVAQLEKLEADRMKGAARPTAPVSFELVAPGLSQEPRYYPTEDECLSANRRLLGDAASQAATARGNDTPMRYAPAISSPPPYRYWRRPIYGAPSQTTVISVAELPAPVYPSSAPTPPLVSCIPVR